MSVLISETAVYLKQNTTQNKVNIVTVFDISHNAFSVFSPEFLKTCPLTALSEEIIFVSKHYHLTWFKITAFFF